MASKKRRNLVCQLIKSSYCGLRIVFSVKKFNNAKLLLFDHDKTHLKMFIAYVFIKKSHNYIIHMTCTYSKLSVTYLRLNSKLKHENGLNQKKHENGIMEHVRARPFITIIIPVK